ncbi:4Fe-4S ferredoxin, partial [candidate division WOR-3 bacterium]|nr:4Fe-4S ferredoxin [candidate division WOR-3 bacterium]
MKELVEKIRKIFSDEKLELLIGYTKGTLPLRSTPSLIESADEADKLIFDFTCCNNLAKYLVDEKKRSGNTRRIGIIAKGCDARAVVQLVMEGQFERENVV